MSRIRVGIGAVLFLAGAFVSTAVAAERGPSTAEERAKAIELAKGLESDPLGPDAKAARRWLTQWLIEVPDVSVEWCGNLMGPIFNTKKNHADLLVLQPLFSVARYVLENPDKSTDRLAANVAAVEGTLRAYEAILKAEPKAHLPFLDELIAKRDEGTLIDHVREAQKTCK